IGAHAQLIGAIEVGEGARIGAGSVVVSDVPPYTTVVGVPGRVVAVRFPDNRPIARLPDPERDDLEALRRRVATLERELAELRGVLHPAARIARVGHTERWTSGELD